LPWTGGLNYCAEDAKLRRERTLVQMDARRINEIDLQPVSTMIRLRVRVRDGITEESE
jgi:hypothetical protein